MPPAYGFIRILSGTKQENTEYEKNWIWHTDFGETRHVLSGSQTLVKYARKRVYAYISRWSGNQNSLVRRIKTEFRLSLSIDRSLLSLDIILTRDVNVANYLYLMSLFLLKDSHVYTNERSKVYKH